jgi:glucose-1-phosphatase
MSTSPAPLFRALIFDIGNVLLRFDFQLALQKLARHADTAAEAILEQIDAVKDPYEAGRLTRAEFQAKAREILRYSGSDGDFVSAWEDIFTENQPVVDLVRRLHGRLPLYLLSNTNDMHVDFILRRYSIFQLFDDAVYSYKVRAAKPEREIYEIAARQFGVRPAETLFIDDLLPNVEGARAFGFHAHHYHHHRHDALLAELAAGGIELV